MPAIELALVWWYRMHGQCPWVIVQYGRQYHHAFRTHTHHMYKIRLELSECTPNVVSQRGFGGNYDRKMHTGERVTQWRVTDKCDDVPVLNQPIAQQACFRGSPDGHVPGNICDDQYSHSN